MPPHTFDASKKHQKSSMRYQLPWKANSLRAMKPYIAVACCTGGRLNRNSQGLRDLAEVSHFSFKQLQTWYDNNASAVRKWYATFQKESAGTPSCLTLPSSHTADKAKEDVGLVFEGLAHEANATPDLPISEPPVAVQPAAHASETPLRNGLDLLMSARTPKPTPADTLENYLEDYFDGLQKRVKKNGDICLRIAGGGSWWIEPPNTATMAWPHPFDFVVPRVFVWLPEDVLRSSSTEIPCHDPKCDGVGMKNGFRHKRVIGLSTSYWVIYRRFQCKKCSSWCEGTSAEWIRKLPDYLQVYP